MYNQDQLILRELAKEVEFYAEQDSAKQVIQDWKNHNALKGTRPMIILHIASYCVILLLKRRR